MRAIRKKKVIEEDYRSPIEVFEARPEQGLSTRQAEERAMAGWDNRPIEPPGKTVGQIIRPEMKVRSAAALSSLWKKIRLSLS